MNQRPLHSRIMRVKTAKKPSSSTAAAFAEAGGLRPELSIEEAAGILYALAGTEVYRALVRERGWTPEQYNRWLFETSCREILP